MDYWSPMFFEQKAKAGIVATLDPEHQLGIVIYGSRQSRHIFLNPLIHPRLRSAGPKFLSFRHGAVIPL
jgi:hypothetical protein